MVLGITGISGAGKGTAAAFFAKKGWLVLEADVVAHSLYRPYNYVWKAVVKRFGEGILTKNDLIDRQKLRALVFDPGNLTVSEEAIRDLNAIVHPEVRRRLEDKIHRHFRRKSNLVVVSALWKEIDLFSLCDKVILITVPEDLALKRIQKRDGIDEAMYRHYASRQSEPPHPHFTVENNGTPLQLHAKLAALYLSLNQES